MSFILDALKKADAERHLGKMPGLHSQSPLPLPLNAFGRPWWQRSTAAVPLLLVTGVLLVAVVWYGVREVSDVAPAVVSGPMAPKPTAVTSSQLPPIDRQPASVPPDVNQPPVLNPPLTVANELPVPPAVPKPVPATKKDVMPPASETPAVATSAKAAEVSRSPVSGRAPVNNLPAAAAPVNAMTMAELPPQIRGELPAIAIGGSMYSANPADRMLLVDKRMLREGDEVAPGLVLETILPKAALLRYKGFLFRMSY